MFEDINYFIAVITYVMKIISVSFEREISKKMKMIKEKCVLKCVLFCIQIKSAFTILSE